MPTYSDSERSAKTSVSPEQVASVHFSPSLVLSLKHMISTHGKLLPRHVQTRRAKHHRQLVRQVKQARMFGFLPFVIRK